MRTSPKPKRQPKPRRHHAAPTPASAINFRAARAALLDRLADAELQHGHHGAAEHLARQAADMREAAR